MQLFDTRTASARPFEPAGTVRLYVCGITPYDATHLGHAFTYVIFDALIRTLESRGHTVRYVRNITDVDDDILRKADELGIDHQELARREVASFDADLDTLGLRRPDAEPLATETAPAIAEAVAELVETGAAYALNDGRVYFNTSAAGDDFGQLSRLDHADMLRQFAEKGGDPEAPDKRAQLDFLLWQPSKEGEPSWSSPWGAGRPGWHIECSVMALRELGDTLDIHGGGRDLIFPHHEAEIVQSERLTRNGEFSHFWLHVGMVGLDGEKMSKSVGNLVFASDLLARHEPAVVRRYLLSHHYRSDWSHDEEELERAAAAVKRWRRAADGEERDRELEHAFGAAIDDDLDLPTALATLDTMAQQGAGGSLTRWAASLGFVLD
ncbi:MAG: cysteine--tRNA ligase [Egibacteraceae bacterium]